MSSPLLNYLNESSRSMIGDDAGKLRIVPIGHSSEWDQYNAMGLQRPRFALTFNQMRHIAERNAWVEACIRSIADAFGSYEFRITPYPEYMHQYKKDEELQFAKQYIERLFRMRNSTFMSFSEVIKATVRDLLIMDAGAIEVVRADEPMMAGGIKRTDRKGRIVGFIPRDAATIYVDHDDKQLIRRYVQLGLRGTGPSSEENSLMNGFNLGMGEFAVFDPSDLIYIRLQPKSGSAYGTPPIVSLLHAINADQNADINIGKFMSTGGIVPGYVAVDESLDPNITRRFEEAFKRIQRAGGREIPIISGGGDSHFVPIAANSREMEQSQLQQYYVRKICAVYRVPPHILGSVDGVNRGIAFAQNDSFESGAITPIKTRLEEVITELIVREFSHKLRFEFCEPNAIDYETKRQRVQELEADGKIDSETAFFMLGLEPPEEKTYQDIVKEVDLETRMYQRDLIKAQMLQIQQGMQLQEEQTKQGMQQAKQEQAMAQQQQAEKQAPGTGKGPTPFEAIDQEHQKQYPPIEQAVAMKKAQEIGETLSYFHPSLAKLFEKSIKKVTTGVDAGESPLTESDPKAKKESERVIKWRNKNQKKVTKYEHSLNPEYR